MSNNIVTSLEPIKVDAVSGQQKSNTSSAGGGFSESFRDANRELTNRESKSTDGTTRPSPKSTNEPEGSANDKTVSDSSAPDQEVSASNLPANEPADETIRPPRFNLGKQPLADQLTTSESQISNLVIDVGLDVSESISSIPSSGELVEADDKTINSLLELLNIDGNELPLNVPIASFVPTRLTVVSQQTAASVFSMNPAVDPRLLDPKNISVPNDVPDELALTTLAEGLDTATAAIKPLASSVTIESALSKTVSTEVVMRDGVSIADIMAKGVVEQLLEDGVLGQFIKDDASNPTRLLLDSSILPTAANAASLTPKAQLSMMVPFQQAQWGQGVAERVMWMSSQGIQEAEIHLDPPELGPLQVKVSVVNEQAHVSFVVQHGSVREALDQNAMRLREMFEAEGIHLADVDVSDQSEQQAEREPEQFTTADRPLSEDDSIQISSETPLTLSANGYSLINTYV